jgi:hypothetical protein
MLQPLRAAYLILPGNLYHFCDGYRDHKHLTIHLQHEEQECGKVHEGNFSFKQPVAHEESMTSEMTGHVSPKQSMCFNIWLSLSLKTCNFSHHWDFLFFSILVFVSC